MIGDRRLGPTTPFHNRMVEGRSVFLVFINLPGGRDETLKYLARLRGFKEPWVPNEHFGTQGDPLPIVPNPALPQFPQGTQVALVRRLMLIDDQLKLRPTSVTQSIQIRVYRAVPDHPMKTQSEARPLQDAYELVLSRPALADKQNGGLRAVAPDERAFVVFNSHGIDPFESAGNDYRPHPVVRLQSCLGCHHDSGVHSLLTRRRLFGPQYIEPPTLGATRIDEESRAAIAWTEEQFGWGLLKGLMMSAPGN